VKGFFAWLLVNGFLMFCLVYGYANEIEGLVNIGLFLVWLDILLSFFMFNTSLLGALKDRAYPVPRLLSHIAYVAVLGFLAWGGFWITAVTFTVAWAVNFHLNNKIDDFQAGNITEEELLS